MATWNSSYKNAHQFYGFMLLAQAGLMGVFLAYDALLFYFFWELALIPAFFLIKLWGGPGRSPAAMQFFTYTMVGSVALLLDSWLAVKHG